MGRGLTAERTVGFSGFVVLFGCRGDHLAYGGERVKTKFGRCLLWLAAFATISGCASMSERGNVSSLVPPLAALSAAASARG